jgi:hypothetical protein
MGAAKWWTGAVAESATAMRDTNDRLLSDSTETIARGFRGRTIEAELGGRRFVARVKSVELYPGRRYGARIELDDARWEGLAIRRVSIAAAEVALKPPPELALALGQVELRGCVSAPELVAWASDRTPDWRLSLVGVNLVEAAKVKGRKRIMVAPQLVEGRLELELRELGWWRLRVRLPRWLRLSRQPGMAMLPEGTAVSVLGPSGSEVQILVTTSTVSRRLDLRALLGPTRRGDADP